MNVLMLLKPKKDVAFIYENNTIRQGLEKMRYHGYAAIPVLAEDGTYVGSVSEGDFLWYLVDEECVSVKEQERHCVKELVRPEFRPAVRINVTMDELLEQAMQQNFICVTDDSDAFIGIVTRRDIIKNMPFLTKSTANGQ
ncbi:MAG: CBS domain-containing protein [Clostridia bacterium]|nr:CBS domain-containing protein [Clostridia bacterium]MBQ7047412.1 CBS domain-containing protein [Clostridia bacterium]